MATEYERDEGAILEALWACFTSSQHVEDAPRIRAMKGRQLAVVLDELTMIERRPGLPFNLFGLVARAKLALQGKKVEEYWEATHKHLGLR